MIVNKSCFSNRHRLQSFCPTFCASKETCNAVQFVSPLIIAEIFDSLIFRLNSVDDGSEYAASRGHIREFSETPICTRKAQRWRNRENFCCTQNGYICVYCIRIQLYTQTCVFVQNFYINKYFTSTYANDDFQGAVNPCHRLTVIHNCLYNET